MKHIKNFNTYSINEGKSTQIFINLVGNLASVVSRVIKKIKGTSDPIFKFKDKNMERKFNEECIRLFDYSVFDAIKYNLSSKFRSKAENSGSLSSLIEERSGVNVFKLGNSILSKLKIENFHPHDKADQKIESTTKSIKKLMSFVSNVDEDVEDTLKLKSDLKEIIESFKKMDEDMRRGDFGSSRDELGRIADFMGDAQEERNSKKDMDRILDKIAKHGEVSLSDREKKDLDSWSKLI
jgi:hypothetical protein